MVCIPDLLCEPARVLKLLPETIINVGGQCYIVKVPASFRGDWFSHNRQNRVAVKLDI